MNWLCWHVGTVTDPKFTLVSRDAKAPRTLVLCVWATLLEHAKQNDGDVSLVDHDAIGILFDADGETVGSIFLMMEERGLIDAGKISNWDKRQHAKSTQRVKEFRERAKHNETNETVSSVSRNTETPETGQTDRQTDKVSREARASRLPDNWEPDSELISWFRAERPDLNLAATVDGFRDYWHSQPGANARKLDWRKTFKNWARNQRAINRTPAPPARIAVNQPG
jgi:hypothetical protein